MTTQHQTNVELFPIAPGILGKNREPLRLLPLQKPQGGQRVVHLSSFVARDSGVSGYSRVNGVLSRFDASLKLLGIELKNRGSV
ncbi:MAG: hypothetical protein WAN72_25640 [Candidatus Acidiferrales bacterium]|jgi:hypothetical protein